MTRAVAFNGGTQALPNCIVAWRKAGEYIYNFIALPVSSILLELLIDGISQETRGQANLVMCSIQVSLLGCRSGVEGWRVDLRGTLRPSSTLISIKVYNKVLQEVRIVRNSAPIRTLNNHKLNNTPNPSILFFFKFCIIV